MVLAASLFLPLAGAAEVSSPVPATLEDAKTSQVTVQALRGNLSILFGSGGNVGVLSTPGGTLMVDAASRCPGARSSLCSQGSAIARSSLS
jgi:hypothetical protein